MRSKYVVALLTVLSIAMFGGVTASYAAVETLEFKVPNSAFPVTFEGHSGEVSFEAVDGAQLRCTSSHLSGELASGSSMVWNKVTFEGCEFEGKVCGTKGTVETEASTKLWVGYLYEHSKYKEPVGLETHSGGLAAKFKCAEVEIHGRYLTGQTQIGLNEPDSTLRVKYAQSKGQQVFSEGLEEYANGFFKDSMSLSKYGESFVNLGIAWQLELTDFQTGTIEVVHAKTE
jgi:hypothetical protein